MTSSQPSAHDPAGLRALFDAQHRASRAQIDVPLFESVRTVDSVCRYGGDEFAILLLETHLDRAKVVAERIRHAVASRNFTVDSEQLKVTVSVGYATFPEHGKTAKALLGAADKAMYAAKAAGKNAVSGAAA